MGPQTFDASRLISQGWRKLLVLAFTAAWLLAGCSRLPDSASAVAIEHEFSPEPPRIGPVVVTLRLADSAAKAITGAHITVEADMSHAGMSPVFGEAKEIEPGRYQANLTLEMAGDWVILLHVVLPGGEKLERQIDVKGVRPN
jgi:YtkA-like